MPAARLPRVQSSRATRLKWTAFIVCVVLAIAGALLGLRSPQLHAYEYVEDVYISFNGSATVYVSASLPSLVALHGMDLPTDTTAEFDRAVIKRAFEAPGVTVSTISTWRRYRRRFVSVRLDTDDVRRLVNSPAFANTSFQFSKIKNGYDFTETVNAPASRPIESVGWSGRELVGYRWHIPSRIQHNNTKPENFLRGNILVWEQPLTRRMDGVPLHMEVKMEGQSILYGTLWLFAISAGSALLVVALSLWWIVKKGRSRRPVKTA